MIKKNTKKTILILGAGLEQKIAIQHAKRMGLKVVAVDGSSHAPGLRFADVGIVADIFRRAARSEDGMFSVSSLPLMHGNIPNVASLRS
jgi:formate-dependent phosphoribosylglycinamide formyltransferase (GAR transformylase)